jgi:putative nucleotidyltransferase with HDIG domain
MRLVSIHNVHPGAEIAKPIQSANGRTLVGINVALTQRMIDSLKKYNISHIYVKDTATEDIEILDDIPFEVRLEASQAIEQTFTELQSDEKKFFKHFEENVNNLQKTFKSLLNEIKSVNNAMNLLTNVYVHDNYTFSHSTNVTIYTLAMAMRLGYNEKQLNEIGLGGMLHDIGKVIIPKEILNKTEKLTQEEFNIIKQHPTVGFEVLRKQYSISLLSAHCAYQHHEKLDGTGYPRGLKGVDIHEYGRVMAIADVFDALTSNRAYRPAMLPHTAMEIIFAGANTHFDPDFIRIFQQSVATYPEGVTVRLNTGEEGVVIKYEFSAPARPLVRVIKDPYGKRLDKPYDIDLAKELSIMITECDAIMG